MNKEDFVAGLKTAEPTEITEILSVIKSSILSNIEDGNPAGHLNLIIVMEELSELIKEISKELRGKGDNINILEELADNQIGIYYVQEICNISDEELGKAITVKIDRLRNIIEKEGRFT